MLDWSSREKILLADKKRGDGTKVEKCWWEKYSKRNLPGPLNELGASWESDFLSTDNIVVEGYTDLLVLQRLQTIFGVLEGFPQSLFIAHKLVVAGSASEMIPVGKLALATNRKVFLMPDSDPIGLGVKTDAAQENVPCEDLKTLAQSQVVFTIEDLLPKKELLEALNAVGKKKYPDTWEEIRRLQNTANSGVGDAIKTRLNPLGDGSQIWREMKLEVVNAAADKLSLNSYESDQSLRASVISLFQKLKDQLDQ